MNPTPAFRQALAHLAGAEHPPRGLASSRQDEYQFPWSRPDFSARMLAVHLDEETHMASRRPGVIDRHVDWLCSHLADRFPGAGRPPHVLDVACGPGLYLHRLAGRGFRTTGFDFAPAPLAWAREQAQQQGLDCRFLELDLTALPPDLHRQMEPVDLMTFWFGDFHSFSPQQVASFLPVLARCLRPGGVFVLEYQPLDHFVQEDASAWSMEQSSVFCPAPHLWLQEWGWDEDRALETHVHWILEQDSGKLQRYVQCHQAWSDQDLITALDRCGLGDPVFYPPLAGADGEFEFPVLSTRRTS